jgi:uridine phosphorylase
LILNVDLHEIYNMSYLSESDLILNQDGSIYHLNLLPEDVASTVITVGDPERVSEISKYFDRIELIKGKREFITHTGYLGVKRITVVSTGIGTDNIDIVLNELDALVNVDFNARSIKETLTTLDIIRIGTSGAIQADLPIGTILASSHGLGLDSLKHFYADVASFEDQRTLDNIKAHLTGFRNFEPYLNAASDELLQKYAQDLPMGITVTAPGFYAPQGRKVRAVPYYSNLIEQLNTFQFEGKRITNLEMETAGIYLLAKILGHRALSINAILASRVSPAFSPNPQNVVRKAIEYILDKI